MKLPVKTLYPFIDFLLAVFVYPAAWILKFVRSFGIHKLPVCRRALLHVGVFPIENHYYEPQFDFSSLDTPLADTRLLPGIDWNIQGQLSHLEKLVFAEELDEIFSESGSAPTFYFGNGKFESGDAEFWYQQIRLAQPRRIIEIGSGYSTLIANKAINRNRQQDSAYDCRHICIEPYEMPWLESLGVEVVREKIEDVDIGLFSELGPNDILFIDSSHIIRPQGDVLTEYLAILPTLKDGVIVHVHDIFSPANYPENWLKHRVKFWNEQYLLEAFLTQNKEWKLLATLNFLHHSHFDALKSVAPFLTPDREPGSFYMQKVPAAV